MSTWFILAVLVCGAAAGLPRTKEDDFRVDTPQGRIVDKASAKYLKEAASEKAGESVVTSPLGIFTLLSLYSVGTSGELRDDIISALGATNYSDLADTYTQLSRNFDMLNSDFLSVANKMYLANGLKLTDAFSRAAASDYRAELENIDFTNADKAAAAINHWADEMTKGHIKTPVLAADLSPDTVLGIFNVIYFKGKWEETFNPNSTSDGEFHVSRSEAVTKSLMSMKKPLFYAESEKLDAKIVELPYKEKGFRMVILLPNDVEGLPSMLDKMAEGDAFYDALQSMQRSSADVDLLLPQFEIRTKMDLEKLISKLGASKVFTESTTGVIESSPVVVGKAFQEAFIKVDEEGATAAAVSGGLIYLTSSLFEPEKLVFHATHPFAFAILHRDTVLFFGTYYK